MDVNVKRAVKMFFSKSSFEMIYFEAFANAVDAGATEFNIHITLPEASDWLNMTLELTDNGVGFTDDRFGKFKKLLDVEERTHKGLGRYYGNRIQRMWFYGVVDFDDRYRLHLLNNGFKPLFSNGTSYFRSKEVFTDLHQTKSVTQNAYIMDFTALVEDANSRNETFLKILQSNFKS